MKLICKSYGSEVYDFDSRSYVVKREHHAFKVSKATSKFYPLACCVKDGMDVVDKKFIDRLKKENLKMFTSTPRY